jgi:hypothetical protein
MIVSWIYFRIWFFPVHVIGRILEEIAMLPDDVFSFNIAFMTVGFLMALTCLHIFWLFIMAKGIIRRYLNGNFSQAISLKTIENRYS